MENKSKTPGLRQVFCLSHLWTLVCLCRPPIYIVFLHGAFKQGLSLGIDQDTTKKFLNQIYFGKLSVSSLLTTQPSYEPKAIGWWNKELYCLISWHFGLDKRPSLIYEYSNMAPTLSGQSFNIWWTKETLKICNFFLKTSESRWNICTSNVT